MVCFVNDNTVQMDEPHKNDIIDLNMEEYGLDEWQCQRVAGGSIIEYPPIFSPTGE